MPTKSFLIKFQTASGKVLSTFCSSSKEEAQEMSKIELEEFKRKFPQETISVFFEEKYM